jgi:hypothetical protein
VAAAGAPGEGRRGWSAAVGAGGTLGGLDLGFSGAGAAWASSPARRRGGGEEEEGAERPPRPPPAPPPGGNDPALPPFLGPPGGLRWPASWAAVRATVESITYVLPRSCDLDLAAGAVLAPVGEGEGGAAGAKRRRASGASGGLAPVPAFYVAAELTCRLDGVSAGLESASLAYAAGAGVGEEGAREGRDAAAEGVGAFRDALWGPPSGDSHPRRFTLRYSPACATENSDFLLLANRYEASMWVAAALAGALGEAAAGGGEGAAGGSIHRSAPPALSPSLLAQGWALAWGGGGARLGGAGGSGGALLRAPPPHALTLPLARVPFRTPRPPEEEALVAAVGAAAVRDGWFPPHPFPSDCPLTL